MQRDLAEVEQLEIAVDSGEANLPRLISRLPNIVSLSLTGSVLRGIRDLGTSARQLRSLWIGSCGLTSLDGITSFPYLEELYASDNR